MYQEGQQNIKPDTGRIIVLDQTSIEHIYPKSAKQVDEIPELEPVKHDLGNLSILTPADNIELSNDPFSLKRPKYQIANLLLNRDLGHRILFKSLRR